MLLVTAKNLLPSSAMRKLYFAHIYPHLTYGLVAWGLMSSKSSCNSLYKLQKDCVRLIANRKRNSNVEPLFSNLKIIKFPDLIEIELCKTGYKIDRKLLPTPIIDLFHMKNGKKNHHYNTRQKALPNIQKHSTPLFNRSFLCKSISLYSKLPINVRHSSSLHVFCHRIKTLP